MASKYFVLALWTLLFSVSCTKLSLGFKVAQYYIPSKIDDYIDATDSQTKVIEQENKAFLEKVKKEILPDLRKSLSLLENDITAEKLNVEQVHLYQNIFRDLFKKALHFIQPGVDNLCQSMTPEQFQYLADKLKVDVDESRDKLNNGKRFEKLKESWNDNLTKFIGTLSEKQESLLKADLETLKQFLPQELKGREQTLTELQTHQKDKAFICQWFERWTKDFDSIRSPEYKDAQGKYHRAISELLFKIYVTLDKKQKETLLSEIKNLTQEIKEVESP